MWLTPGEIAKELKVSERSVYRWIDSGELKAVKLGRIWRIAKEDFDEFIQNKKEKGDKQN